MKNASTDLAAFITEKFIASAPAAAARALEGLATHEACQLIGPLKAQSMVACVGQMKEDKAAAVLRRLPTRQASYVFSHLAVPKAALLMASFSGPYREKIKQFLSPRFVKLLEAAHTLPAGSAGLRMQTDFTAFKTDVKLSEIVEKLKGFPRKLLPTLCLVLAKDGVLKGAFRTAELAFYAPVSTAGSIMTEVPSLLVTSDVSAATVLFAQTQLPFLPVTDENGVVLGILYAGPAKAAVTEGGAKKPFWKMFS